MSLPADRLKNLQSAIDQAAKQANRSVNTIRLIAVSKTKPADMLEQVYLAGQRDFGENYLQEAVDKIHALAHLKDIRWHFIGAIQSNKTKLVAENFNWVHSVDRLKVAQRLASQRPVHLPPLNICIQVNISSEENKAGVQLADVAMLAQQITALDGLRLRGLMAIPLNTNDESLQHHYFKQLKDCLDQLNQQGFDLDTLSMGMSADMPIAIAEGATMIRIGTAIFGPRQAS